MLRTIIFLLATLVVIPIIALTTDISQLGVFRDSFYLGLRIMLYTSLGCFIISEMARNYSQVDKLWSIMPVVYVWLFTFRSGFEPRLILMAILVSAWGIRLSGNFMRRGGYSLIPWRGKEDYRWAVLRKMKLFNSGTRWAVFNLVFISVYQHSLVFLITMPALVASETRDHPLGIIDLLASLAMIFFLVIETVADQQQYNFYRKKEEVARSGNENESEEFRLGFNTKGLWSYSRHPNYFSEMAIWLSFYFFSVASTGEWINWTLTGIILLIFLFFGSSVFSESISSGKYPKYKDYQERVPRFLPSVSRKRRFNQE